MIEKKINNENDLHDEFLEIATFFDEMHLEDIKENEFVFVEQESSFVSNEKQNHLKELDGVMNYAIGGLKYDLPIQYFNGRDQFLEEVSYKIQKNFLNKEDVRKHYFPLTYNNGADYANVLTVLYATDNLPTISEVDSYLYELIKKDPNPDDENSITILSRKLLNKILENVQFEEELF